jgi:hypothetical protein
VATIEFRSGALVHQDQPGTAIADIAQRRYFTRGHVAAFTASIGIVR